MKYLALGDSYTIGEGVAEHERWPNQLAALLRTRGLEVGEPLIVARTAWTTDELADAIGEARISDKFDLVTLLIGVNDQYRSRPVAPFVGEYERLLRKAKAFANRIAGRVVAVSIPDWGATPFAEGRDRTLIGREIEAYNSQARELVARHGMRWADITEITRQMQFVPALCAPDGLHPSGAMYGEWAELIAPIASEALKRQRKSR